MWSRPYLTRVCARPQAREVGLRWCHDFVGSTSTNSCHHLGALTMVRQLREANGGLEPALDKLAREIAADHAIEIDRMRDLLD